MYTDFYNLKEKPFTLSPSSRFLYLGEVHKEALALLTYGVVERKGFTLLTGEVGTGKTTMIHALLSNLGSNTRHVHISNPLLSVTDFLSYISAAVFISNVKYKTKAEFLIEFENFLKRCLQHQKNFVLIIDEAHKLSFELLEEIRLLSNMETADEKLINIFLAGQPELNKKLSQPQCRALLQRINTRYHIQPLDRQGTQEYILQRLEMAGAKNKHKIFAKKAIKTIHKYSKGYPRMINVLADNALLLGYSRNTRNITPLMIKECYDDMQLKGSFPESHSSTMQQAEDTKKDTGTETLPPTGLWKWAVVSLFLLLVISAAVVILNGKQFFEELPLFLTLDKQESADIISKERLQAKERIEQKMEKILGRR